MKRISAILATLALSATPAAAQSDLLSSCTSAVPTDRDGNPVPVAVTNAVEEPFQFLCAQFVNSLTTVQPSVGIAFSGGNPVLGTGTTIGKRLGILPRVSVSARANVALADLPDLFRGGYSNELTALQPQLGTAPVVGVPVASVQGDVVIDLFDGISTGPMLSGVGSIDLLGSFSLLPKAEAVGLSESITNYGAGARIGILRQGLVTPGISVSAMYRVMNDIAFGSIEGGDPGEFSADLRTLSVRGVVSKGILALDLAVGAGYDRYTSDVSVGWLLDCKLLECETYQPGGAEIVGRFDGELTTSAWNVFGNVALDLLVLSIVGEIGYQKAVDGISVDDLEDAELPSSRHLTAKDLGGGRLFGSIGLRLTL